MNYNQHYKVNAVADANELGYQLSDYGKWIYYEYAKNDSGPVTTSYIPGHIRPTSPAVAGGAIFTRGFGRRSGGLWHGIGVGCRPGGPRSVQHGFGLPRTGCPITTSTKQSEFRFSS